MKTAAICTVKDEAPYILEWVAWHRLVGFDRIVIAQNSSTDGTVEILHALDGAGVIDFVENSALVNGKPPISYQRRAYEKAFNVYVKGQCDWAIAIDIDEFLLLRGGLTLGQLIACAGDEYDQIRLNWRHFTASGHTRFEDALTIERFQHAQQLEGLATKAGCVKTLFRVDAAVTLDAHSPKETVSGAFKAIDGSGQPYTPRYKPFMQVDPNLCRLAYLAHYRSRDLESFILKSIRGTPDFYPTEILDSQYWRKANSFPTVPTDELSSRSLAVRREIDVIDGLTKGAARSLHEAAVDARIKRIADIMQRDDYRLLATELDDSYSPL
ncbi:hypothetical protein HYN69_18155 (plasmid) [Gemmobacter aquarius]|uniref:Glycosyl transferase family 2 n=2 Tax=Paragemmobacter aquarius TaxID=2169400 RepID=A0A2S0URW4_9RHOB|nr:hypothetical protein HYN69_18155 [Gemmobacter aquarius]